MCFRIYFKLFVLVALQHTRCPRPFFAGVLVCPSPKAMPEVGVVKHISIVRFRSMVCPNGKPGKVRARAGQRSTWYSLCSSTKGGNRAFQI